MLPLTASAATPNEFAKPLSIVIIGKDIRKKGSSLNTDVNIVVVLSPKDKKITMVSIPRDTKVGCNLISQRLYIEK
ncbi:hypothetical protein C4A76_21095 [Brevibacillus laterosporus]|nr:hypothetical protein C4A76_21095 [Brevibacillus laterosporus]